MISAFRKCGLVGALLAATAAAGPIAARDVEVMSSIQQRGPIPLGTYSLSTTHQHDTILNTEKTVQEGTLGATHELTVECVDCRTWGTAVVSNTGIDKDESLLGDITTFFEDPLDVIPAAFGMNVRIDFENVGGHMEFDIHAADSVTYSLPIFASAAAAVGTPCSEDVSIGVGLFIDLVFTLSAEIDVETGFEFAFPEGAYMVVDPITGHIVEQNFAGAVMKQLPIKCAFGEASLSVAVRVRVEAGTTVEVFGTGFDFELGVYVDLAAYTAVIGSTDACPLSIDAGVNVDVGVFALAVVEIDYQNFLAIPVDISTALGINLPLLCQPQPDSCSKPALPSSAPKSTPVVNSTVVAPTPKPVHPNGTAPLTTSTVYTTDITTITSCAATVLHCPASSAKPVVVTNTRVLYTTVCPVAEAQSQSTFQTAVVPAITTPTPTNTPVPVISGQTLTSYATPVVSTIYVPTVAKPTYTKPTGTSFSVLNPTFNSAAPVAPAASSPAFVAPEAPAVSSPAVLAPAAPAASSPAVIAPEAPAVSAPAVIAPEAPAGSPSPAVVAPETPAGSAPAVVAPEAPAGSPAVVAPEAPAVAAPSPNTPAPQYAPAAPAPAAGRPSGVPSLGPYGANNTIATPSAPSSVVAYTAGAARTQGALASVLGLVGVFVFNMM